MDACFDLIQIKLESYPINFVNLNVVAFDFLFKLLLRISRNIYFWELCVEGF